MIIQRQYANNTAFVPFIRTKNRKKEKEIFAINLYKSRIYKDTSPYSKHQNANNTGIPGENGTL